MDAQALKEHVEAARRTTLTVGERSFTVRLPSRMEMRMTYVHAREGGMQDIEATLHTAHQMLLRGVQGWSGVRASDFGADSADPLPFDASLLPLLLDERPQLAEALQDAFDEAIAQRAARQKEAEKN